MRPLELKFEGKGEVRGYTFEQLMKSETAYLYQLTDLSGNKHYEVFKHKENTQFNVVSYPKSAAFGIWAWCIKELDRATEKFNSL